MRLARRTFLSFSLLAPAALAVQRAKAAEPPVFIGEFAGVAINGYDAVAYVSSNRAVKGDPALTVDWNGATWRFSSAANRDAFKADPARYAPQYGGYCAWAVAQGYTASTDPDAFTVHEGKLYLNYSKSVERKWRKDIPGNVAKGNRNWPAVLSR